MPRFVAWLGVAYLAWVLPSPLCAQEAKLRETLNARPMGVLYVAFGPDGKTLTSGSENGTVRLWDVDTGKEKAALAASYPMALSPDGKTVSSNLFNDATGEWVVVIRDVKTGTITASLEHVPNSIRATSLTFSPDGKTVAGGLGGPFDRSFQQGGVVQWDVASSKSKFVNETFYRWVGVSSITFGPDGKTLAWTVDLNFDSIEEGVHLWDGTSHKETTILKRKTPPSEFGSPPKGSCPAFSPDGKTLAMGDGDTIKLWDVTGRKDIATLRGHSGPVNSVAFRPDGKILGTGRQ
jgi:WD40 repeat protein